ncbi:hypothetical protein D3C73_732930 [compost metagenome]
MPTFTDSPKLTLLPVQSTSSSSGKHVTRLNLIDMGLRYMHEVGSDQICQVCIVNGGSCCGGCRHLANGVGCQLRNTSCTAWLCGFLKYMLHELNLLQDWDQFWEQVPGLDFREDYTPEQLILHKPLVVHNLRIVSEALAADLQDIAKSVKSHMTPGFILSLREKLDHSIDRLDEYEHDPKMTAKIKRNIRLLSKFFPRFQQACSEYRQLSSTMD